MKHVFIYTDGSCLATPGGAGGAILRLPTAARKRSFLAALPKPPITAMEITAVLEALVRPKAPVSELYTDSQMSAML